MSYTRSKVLWLGAGGAAAILLATTGWFGVVSPKLSATSTLQSQTEEVAQQNVRQQATITALQRQTENLPALTEKLRATMEALPFDSGLPAFTRQLASQAREHKVQLTTIGVGGVAPVTGPGAPAAAPNAKSSAGTIFAIPVTLVSTGSGVQQLEFLRAVQTGPRHALVTSTQLVPASGGTASIASRSTMTTQVTVFSAPLAPQEQARLTKLLSGDVSGS